MPDPVVKTILEVEDRFTRKFAAYEKKADAAGKSATDAFDKVEKKLEGLERTVKRAGGGMLATFAKLGAVVGGLGVGFIAVGKALRGVAGIVSRTLSTGFRVATRLGRALVGQLSESAARLDRIAKVSQRIGIGAQALRELRFAAEQAGVDARTLDMALQRMVRRLGEVARLGRGEAKPALEALGIPIERFIGLKPEKQFGIVADALRDVTDSSERLALAFKFFDAEGTAVLPLLLQGSEGIRELTAEFRLLAGVMSEADFIAVQDLNDAINRLDKSFKGLKDRLLIEVAPAISSVVDVVARVLPDTLRDVVDTLGANTASILTTMKDITIRGIAQVGAIIVDGVGTAFATAFRVADAIMVNLFGQVIREPAIDGVNFLITNFGRFTKFIGSLVSVVETLFKSMWIGIRRVGADIVNFLIDRLNDFVTTAQKAGRIFGGPLGRALASADLTVGRVGVPDPFDAQSDFAVRDRNRSAQIDSFFGDLKLPQIDVKPLKDAIEQALRESGPGVEAFFERAAAGLGRTTTEIIEIARSNPALEGLITRLEGRIQIARDTLDTEKQITAELEKQGGGSFIPGFRITDHLPGGGGGKKKTETKGEVASNIESSLRQAGSGFASASVQFIQQIASGAEDAMKNLGSALFGVLQSAAGSFLGGAIGSVFSAKGNAFRGGRVQGFAGGGAFLGGRSLRDLVPTGIATRSVGFFQADGTPSVLGEAGTEYVLPGSSGGGVRGRLAGGGEIPVPVARLGGGNLGVDLGAVRGGGGQAVALSVRQGDVVVHAGDGASGQQIASAVRSAQSQQLPALKREILDAVQRMAPEIVSGGIAGHPQVREQIRAVR